MISEHHRSLFAPLLASHRDSVSLDGQRADNPPLYKVVGPTISALVSNDRQRRDHILAELSRTWVGFNGAQGGFALPLGMADDVWDKARTTVGPWSLCNWWDVPTRVWRFPVVSETSQSPTSGWGGITSQWGVEETSTPAESDGKLGSVTFVQSRLMIYSELSSDIYHDSQKLNRWLSYISMAQMRDAIENAMINGVVPGGIGPQGVISAPSTVVVPKGATTSGQISTINIDAMWSAISEGNSENAVWHANKSTIQALDQLAVSGQWPENLYVSAGMSRTGSSYGTIKGKPLIPCKFCPPIGTMGDLIVCDWSDYVMTYLKPNPKDTTLAFVIEHPDDSGHRGLVGIPEGAIEQRMSDQRYFDADTLAFAWKYRGTGNFLWGGTSTNPNGATIGPAAVLQSR